MSQLAKISTGGLKVTLTFGPTLLPKNLVPPDGPAGNPELELTLEGGFVARARLNGKNYRRMLKQIDAAGDGDVAVVLQATLRAPAVKGGPYVLDNCGFAVIVKAVKPDREEATP